jgi:hypothetical protein
MRHDTTRPSPAHGSGDHEQSDVSLRGIVLTAVGLLVVAIVVQVAMVGLFVRLDRPAVDGDAAVQMIEGARPRPEPRPRLQANPSQDLKAFREEQRRRLYGYGWVDEANGVVHIPIDLAMKIMLERGYPVRPDAGDRPAARALGSSSGRFVTEPAR